MCVANFHAFVWLVFLYSSTPVQLKMIGATPCTFRHSQRTSRYAGVGDQTSARLQSWARAAARYWTRIIILHGATHAVARGISVENFFSLGRGRSFAGREVGEFGTLGVS